MKSRADIEALHRELQTRIKVLTRDSVFLDNPRGQPVINALRHRLHALEHIRANLTMLDWLVNPDTDVTRKHLVDQDKIELV